MARLPGIVCVALAVILSGCGDTRTRPPSTSDAGSDTGVGGCDSATGNPFEGAVSFDDECVAALDPAGLPAGPAPCRAPALVTITRVIDGDTVYANDGDTLSSAVRLIGVDTPEITGTPECYGDEATAFTEQLVGHRAWLTFDATCVDDFDRLLAYLYVGPGPQDFWERQLLRRGLGRLLIISPNDSQRMILGQDEFIARRDSVGLWGACR
jgi:micrococcal nuclease